MLRALANCAQAVLYCRFYKEYGETQFRLRQKRNEFSTTTSQLVSKLAIKKQGGALIFKRMGGRQNSLKISAPLRLIKIHQMRPLLA
jgi:hypothetical protein